jgi:hypothetical protein
MFAAVPGCSRITFKSPEYADLCSSLFAAVRGGLVYRLVYNTPLVIVQAKCSSLTHPHSSNTFSLLTGAHLRGGTSPRLRLNPSMLRKAVVALGLKYNLPYPSIEPKRPGQNTLYEGPTLSKLCNSFLAVRPMVSRPLSL